jgi:hypothetical protein
MAIAGIFRGLFPGIALPGRENGVVLSLLKVPKNANPRQNRPLGGNPVF